MIREVSFDRKTRSCSIRWNELPWKFEAGTPNVEGAIGLEAAVKYLNRLGMENVKKHEQTLTEYALSRMADCTPGIEIYGPKNVTSKSGIIPFGIESLSSHDIALFLDNYGIMVRSGFHCAQPLHEIFKLSSSARASFYIYNSQKEIDRFVTALKEIGEFQ